MAEEYKVVAKVVSQKGTCHGDLPPEKESSFMLDWKFRKGGNSC